jgi:hypothetical protein
VPRTDVSCMPVSASTGLCSPRITSVGAAISAIADQR